MKSELYKLRSVGGCVKAAFELLRTNLKTIFCRTWIPALAMSVLVGVLMILTQEMETLAATDSWWALATGFVAVLVLAYAASVWLYTVIVSLLNGQSMKVNLPRMIRYALLLIGLGIAMVAVMAACCTVVVLLGWGTTTAMQEWGRCFIVCVLLLIVFAVLAVPLIYSSTKYAMETDQKLLSVFKRPYLVGWRHWGYLFLLCLVCEIIIFIVNIVVGAPLAVATMAAQLNATGQAMGDANGLPTYFYALTFVATAISTFISTYVYVWYMMAIYYCYGHIESKEKEIKS